MAESKIPTPRLEPPAEELHCAPIEPAQEDMVAFPAPFKEVLRTRTALQAVLIAAIGTAGGWWISHAFLDPADAISAVALHAPSNTLEPWLFWLRLCLATLPCCLLLSASGLCCFGPALAAAVLCFCGLCDGVSLAALQLADVGGQSILLPYAVFALCLCLIRMGLFLFVRATAGKLSDPQLQLQSGQRGLSPLMLRHLAASLGAGLLWLASCGMYTAWVYALQA